MFNFQRLSVGHKAVNYADDIYNVTERFPGRERFGLTNPLRRAAVSVSSNIAEGSSRSSSTDYARFLEIAYGSRMETVSQLHIAGRRWFVEGSVFRQLYEAADELARMLSGLRTAVMSGNN